MFILNIIFKNLVQIGHLTVIAASGAIYDYGDPNSQRRATVRFHSRWLPWRLILFRELALGEAYMDRAITIEAGTLHEFIDILTVNIGRKPNSLRHAIAVWFKRLKHYSSQMNTRGRSKKLVAHHYDIKADVYESFLDEDLQYTCAYFTDENVERDLERAQKDKTRLIVSKLLVKPGNRILDIGCGWGGPAILMHKLTGAQVTGITLSQEQLAFANARAKRENVADGVSFRIEDYRDVTETYDRISVVGMMEHVGRPQYKTFFKKIRSILKDDGIALVHTIGRAGGPGLADKWTSKYIFPNSYAPSLSEIVRAVERSGLYICDVEVLRTHYQETLAEWSRRFARQKEWILRDYGERFFRMFEYFLAISEYAFRNNKHVIFQVQLAKWQDSVPATRSYLQASAVSAIG